MDCFDRIYRLHNLLTNRRTPIPLTDIMEELECAKASATQYIDDMRTELPSRLKSMPFRRRQNYLSCWYRNSAVVIFQTGTFFL